VNLSPQEFKSAYEAEPELPVAKESLAVALTEIGTRLKLCGNNQPGMDMYKQALCVAPSYAPAHYNMGMVEFEEVCRV
jgi:hypothetical protein